jgi:choline kinase
MQIDYALILAAGKGSRMGEIGRKLPKPLWPIFYKSLIELQVDFCNNLGIQRIFINTHFLSKEIETYLKSDKKFEKITVLYEDPLLDSGGAIHNMASRGDVNYTGNVLTVNADQFLFFDEKFFTEALNSLEKNRAALFGIKVDKNSNYNETVVRDGLLTEITKATGAHDYITYSGLGLIKLDGLRPVPGVTKFFETVASFQKEKVGLIMPPEFEYWDFGTAEIYMNSIKRIFENLKATKDSVAMRFFRNNGAFNGDEENFYSSELTSISLEGVSAFEKNSIVGLGIIQSI